jgi:hypothetical protein
MIPCRSALTGEDLFDIKIGSKEEKLLYTTIPISANGEVTKLYFKDPYEYMKYSVRQGALQLIQNNPTLDFNLACEIVNLRTSNGTCWISSEIIERWYDRRRLLQMKWYGRSVYPVPSISALWKI